MKTYFAHPTRILFLIFYVYKFEKLLRLRKTTIVYCYISYVKNVIFESMLVAIIYSIENQISYAPVTMFSSWRFKKKLRLAYFQPCLKKKL
jgi:hypothetical protein